MNDNPLGFTCQPEPLRNDYSAPIRGSMWRNRAQEFLLEWLAEIRKQTKRKSPRRGEAYSRTMRKWLRLYLEQEASDIANAARKMMDEIVKTHPGLGKYL